MDEKTIDMVAAKLSEKAERFYDISQDQEESDWARDEAFTFYCGYKDAAFFVTHLKEAH